MTQNDSGEQPALKQEDAEAIFIWFNHVRQVLAGEFEGYEVEGQIAQHPIYGPLFAYTLSHDGKSYACGFFLNELANHFQNRENPEQWLSSYFVDMIRGAESRPLPAPPQTEEEAKALIDKLIVPYCAQNVRDEFSPEPVYVDLDLHPEHGPVLEAGFPKITEGSNTCAMPIHYLMTLFLLNRDPAEPLVTALYHLQEGTAPA